MLLPALQPRDDMNAAHLPPLLTRIQSATALQWLNAAGTPTAIRASAQDTQGAFSLFEARDPFGSGPPLHTHTHETESLFILEGRYLVQIGDSLSELSPGDFAYFPIGVPHTYKQIAESGGRMLVWTNPGGYESFFQALHKLSPQGMPPLPDLVACAQQFGIEIVGPPIAAMSVA